MKLTNETRGNLKKWLRWKAEQPFHWSKTFPEFEVGDGLFNQYENGQYIAFMTLADQIDAYEKFPEGDDVLDASSTDSLKESLQKTIRSALAAACEPSYSLHFRNEQRGEAEALRVVLSLLDVVEMNGGFKKTRFCGAAFQKPHPIPFQIFSK